MDSIKFNKLLNEKYFLLKDIARKYNYNEELLDMITFIYVSFYMDFGKKCDFPLYDLFSKVRIIYGNGTVNDVSLANNFGRMPSGSAAVTIFIPNLKVFKNANLKQNPQTIILGTHVNDYIATPALKLEMLAHEIRHALMGYYNTNILLDDRTYYMRSGLQETYYLRNDELLEKFSTDNKGRILDEITNTYISEILVNRIMSFKNYKIENSNLKRYLEIIKTKQPDGRYRAIGYNSEVKLFYPLLLNDFFVSLINKHQFDGDLSVIKDFINKNCDLCDYNQFSSLLDVVYNGNCSYAQEMQKQNVDFIYSHMDNIRRLKETVLNLNSNIENRVLVKKRSL